MARPARKQREIDETRQHILAAAVRVFAARGFDAATMKDIAAEAQYSAPSLYSYFKGKQDILDELADQLVEDLPNMFVVELPRGLSLPQKLELLMRHQSDWMARHRDFLVFSARHVSPTARVTKRIKRDNTDIEGEMLASFADWLRKNARPEELCGRDPALLAMLLMGILHSLFTKWMRRRGKGNPSDDLPAALDIFFHGVCGAK